MNRKTILTKKELAERWGYNTKSIDAMEVDGIIRRLPKLPGVKFSLASIEAIESDGTDNLIVKQRREIQELKTQVLEYRSIIEKMKVLVSI